MYEVEHISICLKIICERGISTVRGEEMMSTYINMSVYMSGNSEWPYVLFSTLFRDIRAAF